MSGRRRGTKRNSSGSPAISSSSSSTFLGVYVSSPTSSTNKKSNRRSSATADTSSEGPTPARKVPKRTKRASESPSVVNESPDESGNERERNAATSAARLARSNSNSQAGNASLDSAVASLNLRYHSPIAPFSRKERKHSVADRTEREIRGTTSSDEEVFRTLTKDLKLANRSSNIAMTTEPDARGTTPDVKMQQDAQADHDRSLDNNDDTDDRATPSLTSASGSASASTSPPPQTVPVSPLDTSVKAESVSPTQEQFAIAPKKPGFVIKLKLPTLSSSSVASSSKKPYVEETSSIPTKEKVKWSKEIACHQDKIRSDRPRIFCESPGCHLNFCERCVQMHYPTMASMFVAGGVWLCPVCRDVCTCQRCIGIRNGTVRRPVPKKHSDLSATVTTPVNESPAPTPIVSSVMALPRKSRPGCERWMNTRGVSKGQTFLPAVPATATEVPSESFSKDEWAPPQERWSDSESEEDEEWREWSLGRKKVVWHEGPERRRRRKTLENELALRAITEGKRFTPPKGSRPDNLFAMDVDESPRFDTDNPATAIEFEPASLNDSSQDTSTTAVAQPHRLASPMPTVRVEDFIPKAIEPSADLKDEKANDDEPSSDAEMADEEAPLESETPTLPVVSSSEKAANLEVTLVPAVAQDAEPVVTAMAIDSDLSDAAKIVQSTPSKVLRYSHASPGHVLHDMQSAPPSYSEVVNGDALLFPGDASTSPASASLLLAPTEDEPSKAASTLMSSAESLKEGLKGVSDEMLGSAVRRALLDIEAERSAAAVAAAAIKSAAASAREHASAAQASSAVSGVMSNKTADVPSSVCESLFSNGEVIKFDDWLSTRSPRPPPNQLVDWDLH